MTVTFTFSLPPRILSPNARSHFHAKARATKKYRTDCKVRVMTQVAGGFKPRWKTATLQMHWIAKTRMRPDDGNAIASFKAGLDGITDAGILDDDRGITHLPVTFGVDRDNPRLVITIDAN